MRCAAGHPCLAASLDLVMAPLAKLRPRVVAQARGEVLEVGVGTGANFQLYGDAVEHVVGIEPDPHMLSRARARAEAACCELSPHQVGAEAMPFDAGRFDTAVATWVFCTIPEVEAAAAELFRVLKPGGELFFVEHVGSPHGPINAMQRAIDPIWQRLAGGCRLTRDPVSILTGAGFELSLPRSHGSDWSPLPMRSGVARKPA